MYGAPATVDKPWFSFQFVEKAGSARWRVAKRPSLVNGTCKVMISASLAIVSKDTNPPSPSCSARGGSLRSTRIPMASHSLSTILPTWPTPTIPIVFPASLSLLCGGRRLPKRIIHIAPRKRRCNPGRSST